jgi:hypothetical protein
MSLSRRDFVRSASIGAGLASTCCDSTGDDGANPIDDGYKSRNHFQIAPLFQPLHRDHVGEAVLAFRDDLDEPPKSARAKPR